MRSGRRDSTTSPISSRPTAPPSSPTGTGHVDADDAAVRPADRLLDDDLVQATVERAVHHQDQPRADLGVLEAREVETADGREDDVVEVALTAAVPLHGVEPQLEGRDPLRAVGAADGGVHRALDGDRRGLDELRPVVDAVELVEALHAPRIGHRDQRVERPVVLHGERDALLVGEAPEDVGRDGAAEVRVELRQAFALERHRASVRGRGRRVSSVNVNRLAVSATNHCLTGCGIGEVLGLVLATWRG
jgi:hypothetical protein